MFFIYYECLALCVKSVTNSCFLFSWFLAFSLISHKKQQGMLPVRFLSFFI